MIRFLLVTPARGSFAEFSSALDMSQAVEVLWAESGGQALETVTDTPVDLVVTDERLGDMTGLELAERLLSVNPMINCAAVSPLPPKQFHEASEGLGLLAQLPPIPGKAQSEDLLQRIKDIQGYLSGIKKE